MSYDQNVATGFGAYGIRLVIEGLTRQFVTDAAMEKTDSDGRYRVNGLIGDSIEIKESVDIARATIDVGGQSIRIADIAGKPTLTFATRATSVWWLDATLTDASAVITLVSTAGLSDGNVIHIDTEAIKIGSVASATSLTGCTRAYWNTSAQYHYTQDGANQRRSMVSLVPQTVAGRRAWLYFYGQGDSPTGDGTLRWIGRCATAPRMSGDMTSWEFSLDPVTSVLSQDLGEDLKDPVGPRGIYYPWNSPFRFSLTELFGATSTSSASVSQTVQLPTSSAGFFETQTSFCTSCSGQITLGGSWKAAAIKFVAVDDDRYRVEVTIGSAGNERYVIATIDDPATGLVSSYPRLIDATGAVVETVAADTTYYFHVEAAVPRGVFGRPNPRLAPFRSPELYSTWPETRVYLGGTAVPSAQTTAARSTWPGLDGERVQRITNYDATNRWLEFQSIPDAPHGTYMLLPYDAAWIGLPSFKLARLYATGTVYDFLTAAASLAPTYANLGGTPDIRVTGTTTDDFDLVTVTRQTVRETATADLQKTRYYYGGTGKKKLSEMLAAEAQLLGCYWTLDGYGRIVLRKIEPSIYGSISSGTIDATSLIVSNGFGELELEAMGTLNTVLFRTVYDPSDDKYKGTPITVRDVSAFGASKAIRGIEVKPISYADGDAESPQNAAPLFTQLAYALLGMFGGPYTTITVEVSMKLFSVVCGNVVTFTSAQMPNTSGTRGISAKPALVVGRSFSPRTAKGTLTLMIPDSRFAGYTPTLRVPSTASGAGTTWVLNVSTATVVGTTNYSDTSTGGNTWFQIGDRISLREWDSVGPTIKPGVVTASSSSTVSVTLDSAWAGTGGATYMLSWAPATDSSLVARQKLYAYLADTDLLVGFSSADYAMVFAP